MKVRLNWYLHSADDDFPLFTLDQVEFAIRCQPSHKATHDSISAEVYKLLAAMLGPPLCHLFNRCLLERSLPRSYAGSRVVPVWKKKKTKK
eukprot:3703383-Amphidinium_carterae.2